MAEIKILQGDCVATMKRLASEGVTVDSVVCDPPYHLTSIVKRFGADNAAPAQHGTDGAFARASRGFMGQQWDGGDVAFRVETWRAAWEILKPGGYLLAFSGTRTYHRMAVAIEDAGFEIRDSILDMMASDEPVMRFMQSLSPDQLDAFARCIDESQFGGIMAWLYGTGFPKSHDVSKAIDKAAGAEREVIGYVDGYKLAVAPGQENDRSAAQLNVTRSSTDAAREWAGWGTALKPAWEPIVVARKPLEGTVAANVLKHGTGAINVDGCRIEGTGNKTFDRDAGDRSRENYRTGTTIGAAIATNLGRFPANVIHDGSDEVIAAFPNAPGAQGAVGPQYGDNGAFGGYGPRPDSAPRLDSGSAARFFYSAKASSAERRGSKHPTVKPVALMAYLVRLVTRRGGTVLDPFAGSGTTGEAAYIEGVNAILCEQSEEYVADIRRRIDAVSGNGPHSASARSQRGNSAAKHEPLPLFAGDEGGEE